MYNIVLEALEEKNFFKKSFGKPRGSAENSPTISRSSKLATITTHAKEEEDDVIISDDEVDDVITMSNNDNAADESVDDIVCGDDQDEVRNCGVGLLVSFVVFLKLLLLGYHPRTA